MNKRGRVLLGMLVRGAEGERARQLEWLESETIQSATFQSRTQRGSRERERKEKGKGTGYE